MLALGDIEFAEAEDCSMATVQYKSILASSDHHAQYGKYVESIIFLLQNIYVFHAFSKYWYDCYPVKTIC